MQIRNPEITKHNILMAAEQEFARAGLHGARINTIAEMAKANKRMIYHYFGSKEGLYKSVLEHNYRKIIHLGDDSILSGNDISEGVQDIIQRYFWFLRDNPNYVKIFAWEQVLASSYSKNILIEILTPAFHEIYEFYQRGCQAGIFRENVNLIQLIISTHSMCFITFTQQELIAKIGPENYLEKRLEHICETVLRTLKTNL